MPKYPVHKRVTHIVEPITFQVTAVLVWIPRGNFNLLNHKNWATYFFYYCKQYILINNEYSSYYNSGELSTLGLYKINSTALYLLCCLILNIYKIFITHRIKIILISIRYPVILPEYVYSMCIHISYLLQKTR